MQTHWRLAFMFDARGGDLVLLESLLSQARYRIDGAAGGNAVRMGVAFPNGIDGADQHTRETEELRTVDGAIEVTIANGGEGTVPSICQAMRPVLDELAEPGSIAVMAGPMHFMVPVRGGGAFLSLAFRRYPDTTVAQFRDWWLNRHSKVAIPVLGDDLLAYDQVHVDTTATRAASEALGVPFVDYDAYDNLTFRDRQGFLDSTGDAEGMAVIVQDEVGRIDDSTRRYALMRDIGWTDKDFAE